MTGSPGVLVSRDQRYRRQPGRHRSSASRRGLGWGRNCGRRAIQYDIHIDSRRSM